MTRRKIIEIDQAKCDGCGQCVTACAEGALEIRDGKARLVSDVYCDGLGACLGECPRGALRVIEREAVGFDEEATRRHQEARHQAAVRPAKQHACPGSAVRTFAVDAPSPQGPTAERSGAETAGLGEGEVSALGHWPIQLRLVPPGAPFLRDADLLLAADCVPFALAGFHRQFLRGRPVLVGCPKLDDAPFYVEKLAEIFRQSSIRRVTVLHMEVPCCTGLVRIAEAARRLSGIEVPLDDVTISIRGEVLQRAGLSLL
ncbi:MAG: 4Fe-4S binding protein [Thermoguttaceae bacterium]|jgi:Fe-S-cluster-containing hydrogenase component 2|nr:4Fe-4S binding protein [Thermoguttaceae bacterium]